MPGATSDGKLVAVPRPDSLIAVTDSDRGRSACCPTGTSPRSGSLVPEPIPLIEDLLGAWPDVRFNIDLKDEPGIALLPGVLRRTGAWDRVRLTSFSGSRLRAARGR